MEDKSLFNVVEDYGKIIFDISKIANKRNLTPTKIVKLTGLHHNVVNKYLEGKVVRYDGDTLAKFCYILNCDVSDIMYYKKPKK